MLSNKTVFVIEDHGPFRRLVCTVLASQMNCRHVLQAESANIALEILNKHVHGKKVDIILCDWEMPGMSGKEFLEIIRQDSNMGNVKFVMITGRRDKKSLAKAKQAGVDEYIVKPCPMDILIQKVKGLVDKMESKKKTKTICEVRIDFDDVNKHTGVLLGYPKQVALQGPLSSLVQLSEFMEK